EHALVEGLERRQVDDLIRDVRRRESKDPEQNLVLTEAHVLPGDVVRDLPEVGSCRKRFGRDDEIEEPFFAPERVCRQAFGKVRAHSLVLSRAPAKRAGEDRDPFGVLNALVALEDSDDDAVLDPAASEDSDRKILPE